jgi:hypothetical protein
LVFTAKNAKEAAKIAEKERQPQKLHHYRCSPGVIAYNFAAPMQEAISAGS